MAKKKVKTTTWLKLVTHIAALMPLTWLIIDFFTNNLTINPIQEATQRTGDTAVTILILSLAVTPVISLTKFRALTPTRRLLGLYAFGYALFHASIFVAVDYGFNLSLVVETIIEKQFTIVGAATLILMIPLAITSTKGWQKRLGKKWKSLHKLAYLIGPLAILHYAWALKADLRWPLIFAAIIILLFILRTPFVKENFNNKVAINIKKLQA
jgi:sulfoxide reductase heme-binding subunit YedZ